MFARVSSCDITPLKRPVQLAGYASRRDPVSTVLDRLEISGLLLESGGPRCLIFSFDLLMVGTELQQMILDRLAEFGFEPRQIVLLASHTHFAPGTDQACSRLGAPDKKFVNEVVEATEYLLVKILNKRPSEIRLEMLGGHLNHSINRRRYWPFPTLGRTYGLRLRSVNMAPNPEGPKNELATILLLREVKDERVLCVMWHYTCHPTSVVPESVISADYPGVVRRALQKQFGKIPCVFAQGFCGDVRPDMPPSKRATKAIDLVRRYARLVMSGPSFQSSSAEEWTHWSGSLAAKVLEIVRGSPCKLSPFDSIATGSASVPLSEFFEGTAPDKPLTVQVIRLGEVLEFVAISAETTVEWEDIINQEIPVQPGRVRLYAGYLGALFGYLPTASQVGEGGYEVEGFQPLFGLSGWFDAEKIRPAIVSCVKRAFEDLQT